MSKAIRVEGLDEVIEAFRHADGLLAREGRSYLRDLGIYGVKQAQINILNEGAVDTNELIQGMRYELRGLTATIRPSDAADKYAVYVEEGTKPHTPPVSALQGWADRHGIPVWAVVRKIAREGTEPRYIFRKTFQDVDNEVDSTIPRFIDNLLRRL